MPAKLPITQRNLIFTFSITYAIGLQQKITKEQNTEVDSEDEYGIYCSENLQKQAIEYNLITFTHMWLYPSVRCTNIIKNNP